MNACFTAALVAGSLFFGAMPAQAQYAFTNTTANGAIHTSLDPEETPKARTYKVIHGVVQGRQGALPGATVWLHGSRTIAVANAEGEFELRVPADAQVVELTCGYGGLEDEVVRLAPVQALGSLYLLRSRGAAPARPALK